MILEHPLTSTLSQHSMRQVLAWILQPAPIFSSFSPRFKSHGVLLALDNNGDTSQVPRLHIKIIDKVTRSRLSALDRVFPPTSNVDSNHMVTRLLAIVTAMFKDNWRKLTVEGGGVPYFSSKSAVSNYVRSSLLDNYPGTPQNIIMCKLLAGFGGTAGVSRFLQILKTNHVWDLRPDAMVKVLKQSSTMLRR